MMSSTIVSLQAQEGRAPGHEASTARLFSTKLNHRGYRTAMRLLGLEGQLDARSPLVERWGRIKWLYPPGAADTIEGGASETERNILATLGLNLLRD